MIQIPLRSGETKAEAVARYCQEHGVDPESLLGERLVFLDCGFRAPIARAPGGYRRQRFEWDDEGFDPNRPLPINLGTI